MSVMHVDPPALPALSLEDQAVVRTQLERLLRSSHFRNSRRYPALLRYIVEEALEGRGPLLKERTLGVEVFGRPPDYDTASDPIVRVTVAEVRKRIAQYYHEDAHGSELRIELNPGSYIPEFLPGREPEEHAHEAVTEPVAAKTLAKRNSVFWLRIRYWIFAAALCVAVAVGFGAWRWARPSAIDQLWAPVFATPGTITYCLPMSVRKNGSGDATTTEAAIAHALDLADTHLPASGTFFDHQLLGENVVYSDVLAMMKLETVVERQKRPVRERLNLGTNLNDLREGPTIFLGGLSNQWTLQILEPLRYRFAGTDADQYYIRDAKDPNNQQWSVRLRDKMTTVNRDFAIIARVHSDELGQTVMIAAGIGMSGTAAAGEFLADPKQAKELQRRMGSALKDHDFQAVLQTDVVDGIAGPAKILAIDIR
jgi:hypothetical protein